MQPELAAPQHEGGRARFLLGLISADSSRGVGEKFVLVVSHQFRLMMLLASRQRCCGIEAPAMARAAFKSRGRKGAVAHRTFTSDSKGSKGNIMEFPHNCHWSAVIFCCILQGPRVKMDKHHEWNQ